MEVYIVTNYADGEDFSGETDIVGVYASRDAAVKAFNSEVEDWKNYANDSDDVEEDEDGMLYPDTDDSDLYYEVTNSDSDYHAIVKLEAHELED